MAGWQVLEHGRNRHVEVKLDTAVPHFDQCSLQRVAPEQRRIALQRLEIAADGDRFRNHGAVVEHQCRHPLQRIDSGIGLTALLQRAEVHLLGGNLNAFFGQKYPHPPRVRRAAAIIELHRESGLPSLSP
jgi:hypothetical protein